MKPKNPGQASKTKTDLCQVNNPIDLNIEFSKVIQTRDGGIVLGCSQPKGLNKMTLIAEKKVSIKYDVHVLNSEQNGDSLLW